MSRIKPYTTNQVTFDNILNKRLRIPMNQREYCWGKKEITLFLDDIFKTYEEDKYFEKMGSIINLNYDNVNDIYDGQQRILTIVLILITLSRLSEKIKIKIEQLLTLDSVLDNLTEEQKQLKVYHNNVDRIPKIYCINPHDMDCLVYIFNEKIESFVDYVDNLDDFKESFHENQEYICKRCKKKISRRTDFKRHIKNSHNYLDPNSYSSLKEAYIEIYNYIVLKKYDSDKLIALYKFILNDIDIQYYDCNDPEYVSRIFDWENNRGLQVKSLDIIKNSVLVKIADEKKTEIYNKWVKLKDTSYKIYKDFGQKIFDIAIQIYNNHFERKPDHGLLFKPIIKNEDTYKEIYKFFEIVEKLFEIMDQISKDKLGRLINNKSRISLNWEAYMWCLLPIFYKTDNIDRDLIKLLTKWLFRNLQFKSRNDFNNLCYSNEFIKITNEVLKNQYYNYYKDIEECLLKNKHHCISDENYLISMKKMDINATNAIHTLLFLETCINTDSHTVSLDLSLEHIYCKKNKANLRDQSLIDNIGNLTLLEAKNSENGHKGNSSLGSKSYDKKIESYRGSTSKITRLIVEKYQTFTEETIIKRNDEIVNLLNKYTNY